MTIGTPSDFQKENRILVSTLAAYGGREVPRGFEWLKQSCEKFGVQLTVFGWGEQFTNMYDSKLEYVGYKIWGLRNEYDYVLNIDSADTLFLRPFDYDVDLPDNQYEFRGMTFAAERNCFPIEQLRQPLIDKSPDYLGTYRFLNAGGFCGEMKDIVRTFAYMKYKRWCLNNVPELSSEGSANTFTDDQASWSLEFLNDWIDIDFSCEVFQTLWGVDREKDIEIKDGRLRNVEHNNFPLILHANGSAEYESIYNKIVNC